MAHRDQGSVPELRWRDRSTGDILVLMITLTVCFGVLASGLIIAAISLFHPESDVSNWVSRISGILNTMLGLLAGFLAGRNGNGRRNGHDPSSTG
jgi:uncharacterized membrane protein HdeD (DUF308 family)